MDLDLDSPWGLNEDHGENSCGAAFLVQACNHTRRNDQGLTDENATLDDLSGCSKTLISDYLCTTLSRITRKDLEEDLEECLHMGWGRT